MIGRRALLAAGLGLGLTAAGPAVAVTVSQPVRDPQAWLRQLYARLARNGEDPPRAVMTPRLQTAYAIMERDAGGEVGRLDFSPFIDGQDGAPRDVRVNEAPAPRPGRRAITVDFLNGRPVRLVYFFEAHGKGWLLDDIAKPGTGGWVLSRILVGDVTPVSGPR